MGILMDNNRTIVQLEITKICHWFYSWLSISLSSYIVSKMMGYYENGQKLSIIIDFFSINCIFLDVVVCSVWLQFHFV